MIRKNLHSFQNVSSLHLELKQIPLDIFIQICFKFLNNMRMIKILSVRAEAIKYGISGLYFPIMNSLQLSENKYI